MLLRRLRESALAPELRTNEHAPPPGPVAAASMPLRRISLSVSAGRSLASCTPGKITPGRASLALCPGKAPEATAAGVVFARVLGLAKPLPPDDAGSQFKPSVIDILTTSPPPSRVLHLFITMYAKN
ncbi:hypothetical protein JNB11_03190 [Kocuria palustris]|nr:hypothetical protein [Kocuria palustris]